MSYLDRIFAPSLWSPQQIPLEDVELIRDHPDAQGLVGLYLPGTSSGLSDLTGVGPTLTMGAGQSIAMSNEGPGLYSSGSATGASAPVAPSWAGITSGTLIIRVALLGASSSGLPLYVGFDTAANNNQQPLIYNNGSTVELILPNGNFYNTSISTTNPQIGSIAITWSTAAESYAVYYNGIVFIGGAWAPSNYNLGASGMLFWIGGSSNCIITKVAFYDQVLSVPMLARLYAEPFAMLRPKRRISFGFVPSSGNSTVGLATIGPIAASGQTIATDIASGLAKIGPIAAAGHVTQTNQTAGLADLGPIKAAGQIVQTNVASGVAALGPIAAKGTIPDSAAGLATLGSITAAATVVQTNPIAALSNIGPIGAVGELVATNEAQGVAQIGPIAAAGEIVQTDVAAGLASIGPITASGELSEPGTAIGLTPIGPIVASGDITQTNPISALARLAAIAAAGTISQINVASGAAPLEITVAGSVTQTNPVIGVALIGLIKAVGALSSGSIVGVCSLGPISVVATMAAVGPDFAWSAALPSENLSVALPPEMLSIALPPGD